jgi:hypothetical protein
MSLKRSFSTLFCLLLAVAALADTPPPGTVKVRGGTDNTTIGNVTDSLKVDVTNPISASISGTVGVTQSTSPWVISGNTGRTWTLLNTTDSVNVGNFPATFGVTQSTSPWVVNGSGFTQPISAVSLPLPTGAATESTLSTLNGKVTTTANGIKVDGSAVTQPVSGTVAVSNFPATQPVSGTVTANQGTGGVSAWKVDGSAVTQPVSGTVTANAGTGNFTVVQPTGTNLHTVVDSSALPTGASTSANQATVIANQTNGTQQTKITDGTNSVTVKQLSNQVVAADYGLVTNSVIHGLTTGGGGGYVDVKVNPSGSLTVDASGSSVTVSGTVTANQGSPPWSVSQSGTWTTGRTWSLLNTTDSVNSVQSGTWTTGRTWTLSSGTDSVNVGNFPATQAVTQSTSPWVDNISQFGGNNVVTGTGASGVGIPRVTVSNDSNILATQSGTWNINNISGTVSLPTGAATSANQTTLGSQTTKINDGTNTAAVKASTTAAATTDPALVVSLSPNSPSPVASGRTSVTLVRNDYSSVNVTTAAYTQLVASTADTVNELFIFDSSGQTLFLAVGGAGSEVNKAYIVPGGNGILDLNIPSGSRVSVKAVSANATAGELSITFLK